MFRPYMAIIRFFPPLRLGGYYITLIYIYIYIVSPLVEGGFILGVSAGCQPPFLQGVAVVRLSMVGLAETVSHIATFFTQFI